jgi:hypothetical protein
MISSALQVLKLRGHVGCHVPAPPSASVDWASSADTGEFTKRQFHSSFQAGNGFLCESQAKLSEPFRDPKTKFPLH